MLDHQITQERIERDLEMQSDNGLHFCIFGPTMVLPGALFNSMNHAIEYAEDVVGLSWNDLTAMGYSCIAISLNEKRVQHH